jgi:hypothetical protein
MLLCGRHYEPASADQTTLRGHDGLQVRLSSRNPCRMPRRLRLSKVHVRSGSNSAVGSCQMNDRSYLGSRHAIPITPCCNRARRAIQSLASERLKSTRSGGSTIEHALSTHDFEQTFASPFRALVNGRSREPLLVTHCGRVAPHNTSA